MPTAVSPGHPTPRQGPWLQSLYRSPLARCITRAFKRRWVGHVLAPSPGGRARRGGGPRLRRSGVGPCRIPGYPGRIPRVANPFRQGSEHKARQQSAASAPAAPGADSPPSPRADNKNAHSSLRAVCARRLLQRARRRPGGGGEHEVSNQPGAKRAGRRARGRRRAGEAVLRPAADVQPVHVRDARRTRRAHPRFNASPCARTRGGSEQREFARPPAPICPAPLPLRPVFHPPPHPPPRPSRSTNNAHPPLRPAVRGPSRGAPTPPPRRLQVDVLEPVHVDVLEPDDVDVLPVHDGALPLLLPPATHPPRRLSLPPSSPPPLQWW